MHRHGVGALLGVWAAMVFASRSACADIERPEARLESGAVQYGAAFAAELLASPGAICPANSTVPCIIGSGGGLAVRAGYRTAGPLYLGGAYEFSKQDAHKSITLAILQQVRGELRYYLPVRGNNVPFVTGGVGLAGYGSKFSIQTIGGMAFLGAGVEFELSRTSVLAVIASYRPILLLTWQDTSQTEPRPTGVLSMVGLELALEDRVPSYKPPSR